MCIYIYKHLQTLIHTCTYSYAPLCVYAQFHINTYTHIDLSMYVHT